MIKINNKIIVAAIFVFIFTGATSFVMAEDDQEDNYQSINTPTLTITPTLSPVVTPAPVPVGIPQTNTINNSVVATQDNLVDSDSDGIIDILDMHPGEDDFAYAIKDVNDNGIADDLEYLLVR